MKILYISKGDHVDYQDDCLSIGLKELFESNVVDINKRSHIYDTYDVEKAKTLYGKGMSVTRVIPDIEVDRTDIKNKIKTKYFDFIVYGSIWRCAADIEQVLQYYPKNRVIVVDGEDEQNIHKTFDLGILYFKRELIYKADRLYPISFAIPTNKVVTNTTKMRPCSICTPLDRKTYIYNNERDYYDGYRESCFGVTVKKAGWDCMRHYEILANDCVPVFPDLYKCPELTMVHFPKKLCNDVLCKFENKNTYPAHYFNVYDEYKEMFREHTIKYNTTKALAIYFIDTITKF
jgi:hypothetical protein